ncbi:hypothetical protein ACROYT_G040356 [Oculina patagonica]
MAEKAEFTAIKGDEDVALSPQEERKARRGRRKCIVVTVVVVIVLILVAFVAGYLVRRAVKPGCEEEKTDHDEHQDEDQDPESYHKEAIKGISKEHIEESLKYLTKAPHPSGSAFSNEQAQRIKKKWEESGFDKVELKKYDVLLSYPERPGIASIKSDNGTTLFTAQRKEKVLEPSENKPDVLPPFNAYSSSGNVTARLVYVNYGMVEDFKKLREMNISVKGHIVIAKYGKIYRGDKARIAADKGAIGLILYTDPIDYSPEGVDFTYPKSWWLPPSGVQRGTLLNLEEGDPLTPGYPARDDIYRMPQDKLNLPSIPVYPVSYEDAAHFLKLLTVNEAPKDWQGGLKMKYNITMAAGDKRNVSLDIKMKLEKTPIYNVIGTITGREEPDRLVLLGNHRDAWTFGAADASSGTAAMLEISKKLGEMKAKGWKPRRTMVLCSWGAEEHGMLGSTEWAEDFANLLSNRAVVYLNVDVAVKGNFTLRVQSSPLLEFAFMEATKKIQPPGSDNPDDTLYEDWKNKNPDKEDPNLPTAKGEIESWSERGSGWVIERITEAYVNVARYQPLRGGTYLPLPANLAKKKAIVNVRNRDNECLKWALRAALYPPANGKDPQRTSKYPVNDEINYEGIVFPTPVKQIDKLEAQNSKLAINVFGWENNLVIVHRISKKEKNIPRINLMLIESGLIQHYCFVKRVSALLYDQSKSHNSKHFCMMCLTGFTRPDLLENHEKHCNGVNGRPTRIEMPKNGENTLSFQNYQKQMKVPYVIYADFEALVRKMQRCERETLKDRQKRKDLGEEQEDLEQKSYTEKTEQHEACGFSYTVVRSDGINKPPVTYRGKNAVEVFLKCLLSEEKKIRFALATPKPLVMTAKDWEEYRNATSCHICNESLISDPFFD